MTSVGTHCSSWSNRKKKLARSVTAVSLSSSFSFSASLVDIFSLFLSHTHILLFFSYRDKHLFSIPLRRRRRRRIFFLFSSSHSSSILADTQTRTSYRHRRRRRRPLDLHFARSHLYMCVTGNSSLFTTPHLLRALLMQMALHFISFHFFFSFFLSFPLTFIYTSHFLLLLNKITCPPPLWLCDVNNRSIYLVRHGLYRVLLENTRYRSFKRKPMMMDDDDDARRPFNLGSLFK